MLSDATAAFYSGVRDPGLEALLDRVLPQLAADVRACGVPRLAGVWLGGGYGRGEGGVRVTADGRAAPYNDVDLFVFMDGASSAEKDACARALAPIAAKHAAVLGVDVDFCRPRNPADYKKDERRLMIQELKRGHVALLGGTGLLDSVRTLSADELPRTEAVRLLMNRGMGLVLAAREARRPRTPASVDFFLRNVNKAVLGAGDARLLADGRYAWTIGERAARLGDARYDAAVAFKFRPTGDLPSEGAEGLWRAARDAWMQAAEAVGCAGPRTVREAARWVVRRRSLGPLGTFGRDCAVRVLAQVRDALAKDFGDVVLVPSLLRDWQRFN